MAIDSKLPDSNQIPTVGIITTWIDSAYWTSVLSGASDALRESGASVVCFTLGFSDAVPDRRRGETDPFFELANSPALDGLIVPTAASFAAGASGFFKARAGLPMVSVGEVVPDVPSVVVDNVAGTKTLIRYLIEKCRCTRIGYIRGPETNVEANARYQAYVETLKDRDLEPDEQLVATGNWMEPAGARAALQLLDAVPDQRPDVIVAANDLMALGAMRAVRERGLLVPRDIAIAGFDDIEASLGMPPLTTVRQPTYEIGRCAAELVLEKIHGRPVREKVVYPAELVQRESTPIVGPRPKTAIASSQPPPPPPPPANGSRGGGIRFLELGHAPPAMTASTKLIKLLREDVYPHLQDKPEIRDEMEELLSDLESLMKRTATEAASYHKAAESAQAQALLHLRRASARASSLDMLIDDISELLPALNMDAFYLTLFHKGDPTRARLVLANESGRRIPLRTGGLEFEPRSLVPPSLRRRGDVSTSVAQPLQYGGVRLGFVVMRGNLYDAQLLGDVCQVVSMALSRLEAHAGD
jgi:DNA-binding LacI/PurR family transcriptional regulator